MNFLGLLSAFRGGKFGVSFAGFFRPHKLKALEIDNPLSFLSLFFGGDKDKENHQTNKDLLSLPNPLNFLKKRGKTLKFVRKIIRNSENIFRANFILRKCCSKL